MSDQQGTTAPPETETELTSWVALERSIIINASSDGIGDMLSDVMRYPSIFPGTQSVNTDGVFPAVGGKIDLIYKAAGMSFHMDLTMLENEPRRRVMKTEIRNVQFVTKNVLEGKNSWFWEPEGEGTKLTLRYEYEVPNSTYGKQLERWVIRRLNADNMEGALKNIKRLVEASKK